MGVSKMSENRYNNKYVLVVNTSPSLNCSKKAMFIIIFFFILYEILHSIEWIERRNITSINNLILYVFDLSNHIPILCTYM